MWGVVWVNDGCYSDMCKELLKQVWGITEVGRWRVFRGTTPRRTTD